MLPLIPKQEVVFVFQRLIPTVVVMVVLGAAALAQQTTATVTGTVTDPTGALVPGVTITVTNLATNGVRETKSDETGSYTLPFLPTGEYSVMAVAPGFQTQKIDHIASATNRAGGPAATGRRRRRDDQR